MTIIETHGLSKNFKMRGSVVEAVRSIDMEVEAGEIFGFLGPNGAGKTTTLRMLATLLTPSGGQATVVGCDLLREPNRVREQIGYVSQSGGADPNSSGRENLVLQARLYGMSKPQAEARTEDLIVMFELEQIAAPRSAAIREGRGAGSTWRLAWPTSLRSCSSTSRPPASIHKAAPDCGTKCAASETWAQRSS